MNTQEFVDALCKYTLPETAKSAMVPLKSRQNGEELIEQRLRDWYERQDPKGRELTEQLVQYSVACMLFHILVVLDNCDAIENGADKGELVLHYSKDGDMTKLGGFPELLYDCLPDFADLVDAASPNNLS